MIVRCLKFSTRVILMLGRMMIRCCESMYVLSKYIMRRNDRKNFTYTRTEAILTNGYQAARAIAKEMANKVGTAKKTIAI